MSIEAVSSATSSANSRVIAVNQQSGGAPAAKSSKSSSSSSSSTSESESSSSDTKIYDKMDTDKDGTVSYEEEQAYYLKHPEAKKKKDVESKLNDIAPWERTGENVNTQA